MTHPTVLGHPQIVAQLDLIHCLSHRACQNHACHMTPVSTMPVTRCPPLPAAAPATLCLGHLQVENRVALLNFEAICLQADGVIFSRGNLGLDVVPEKMALVQKSCISRCNLLGKPCIVTRLVDTMVSAPRPTRSGLAPLRRHGALCRAEDGKITRPMLKWVWSCDDRLMEVRQHPRAAQAWRVWWQTVCYSSQHAVSQACTSLLQPTVCREVRGSAGWGAGAR